jgi:hypothetical protein
MRQVAALAIPIAVALKLIIQSLLDPNAIKPDPRRPDPCQSGAKDYCLRVRRDPCSVLSSRFGEWSIDKGAVQDRGVFGSITQSKLGRALYSFESQPNFQAVFWLLLEVLRVAAILDHAASGLVVARITRRVATLRDTEAARRSG